MRANRNTVTAALVGFALVLGNGTPARARDFEKALTHQTYAPCKGFGLAGSFTATVKAVITDGANGKTITNLLVDTLSPSFSSGTPSVSSKLVVRDGKKEISSVPLRDAWFPVVRAPGDRAVTLYMPAQATPPSPQDRQQKALFVPKNANLVLVVSAVVTANAGTCALGTLEEELPI